VKSLSTVNSCILSVLMALSVFLVVSLPRSKDTTTAAEIGWSHYLIRCCHLNVEHENGFVIHKHTHTQTHTHIIIYMYIREREREREREKEIERERERENGVAQGLTRQASEVTEFLFTTDFFNIHMYICILIYMYKCVCVCVCACVCVYAYVYVCMCVCVCVYMYMYICICICIHIYGGCD
jgi:hypothetical protein